MDLGALMLGNLANILLFESDSFGGLILPKNVLLRVPTDPIGDAIKLPSE